MIDLIKGDCLEVMKEIESGSIDAIICDPPYGTTACKWDSVIDFDLMWEQLNRIIKPNGAIVLFGSEPFSSALRMSNIKKYKYDWIWNKRLAGNFLNAKIMPLMATENISVFINGKNFYYPIMIDKVKKNAQSSIDKLGKKRTNDTYGKSKLVVSNNTLKGYPKNIINIDKVSNKKTLHPTQKPVALMEYLIKTYTNENETVLDFTMGSGSTGVAAKQTNRNFIGIEQDDKYFNIASERINGTLF